MPPTPLAAAVVPAAGASRRMGRPKLLLPWGEATVLDATVGALLLGGAQRVVVVRAPDGPLVHWQPPRRAQVTVNPHPEDGMLSTIRVGIEALESSGVRPDPLLVCPADLPALCAATVAALLAAYRESPRIVVPTHMGRRGHPLLIPPRWHGTIRSAVLEGGLRGLLDLAAAEVVHLRVDDAGAVLDIDTPEDYRALPR